MAHGGRKSTITPDLEREVVRRFLSGESFKEVAASMARHGITQGMVAGYIYRQGIKRDGAPRSVPAAPLRPRAIADPQPKPAPPPPPPPPPPPVRRDPDALRYDVYDWLGAEVQLRAGLQEALAYVPTVSEEAFRAVISRGEDVVTTNFFISPAL